MDFLDKPDWKRARKKYKNSIDSKELKENCKYNHIGIKEYYRLVDEQDILIDNRDRIYEECKRKNLLQLAPQYVNIPLITMQKRYFVPFKELVKRSD